MNIVFLIVYLITNFLILKYNLHMFQLNYYMPDTQVKWLVKNKKKFITIFCLDILGIVLIAINPKFVAISALLLIIDAILVYERNVKKKIVYTNRVKRMYITNYIILCILGIALYKYFNIFAITLLAINSLSTFYMIILNYINLPINKMINNYYVNDAKKKLASMPNLKIIAITGSYGKTSTKNYVTKLLSSKYNVLATPGNFNTLLGITRTIRNDLKPTHEIFVCEVGIDRVGQMDKIIKLINPNYCMITAIGPQHLETFGSQENITKSKMTLLDGLKENGVAFLNLDNELIANADKKGKKYIGYGIKNNTNNKLKIVDQKYSQKGIEFTVEKDGEKYKFNSKLLGEHNLIDLFGAITIADYMGIDMKYIINSVKHINSVEHRLNLIPGAEYNLIDDSYNSNPIGSSNALKVLKEFDGTRILITPGMVELGTKQDEYNYKFGELATECCDYIILVNKENTKPIQEALKDKNYPEDKIIIEDTFNDAFSMARKIDSGTKEKYILIENDLPDNY